MEEPRSIIAVIISAALSAIPAVGGPLQTFFDYADEQQRYRVQSTAREICDLVGEEVLLGRVQENAELETLLTQALDAASRTGWEAKRKLLAKAVAHAFLNDEAVDPGVLIVSALKVLEPVHARALVRLAHASDLSRQSGDNERKTAVEQASFAEPTPVLAALIQTGVALPATLLGGGVKIWDVSDFGRQLLQDLRAVAVSDDSAWS